VAAGGIGVSHCDAGIRQRGAVAGGVVGGKLT
jgi:hypothetical protein